MTMFLESCDGQGPRFIHQDYIHSLESEQIWATSRRVGIQLRRIPNSVLWAIEQSRITPGQTIPVSRAKIIQTVWEYEADLSAERNLRVVISYLRKQFASIGVMSPIKTEWGVGYSINIASASRDL